MNNAGYSVLMSVYAKENPEYLKASIESMLVQTISPEEFVIVRDGPLTPELDRVLEEFKQSSPNLFRYVCLEKNAGLGPALAAGVNVCRNELIARMDSDDISHPKRCEILLEEFKRDPSLDIVGCFENEFNHSVEEIVSVHKVPETQDEIMRFMRRRCPILHPTVIYKKSAVLSCGGYRDYQLFEDYDLFARMIHNGANCYNVQAALYYLRINENFYRRRGGLGYMKTQFEFKKNEYKRGFISLWDLIVSAGGHAAVCLMPNRLRSLIYLKMLRR